MTPIFRIVLIFGALLTLMYFLRKIRKCELEIDDSVFWIVFAFLLVVIAIFPGTITFFSSLLGIESPANFIFLLVIGVLLIREFSLTIQISRLKSKLRAFVQEEALDHGEDT